MLFTTIFKKMTDGSIDWIYPPHPGFQGPPIAALSAELSWMYPEHPCLFALASTAPSGKNTDVLSSLLCWNPACVLKTQLMRSTVLFLRTVRAVGTVPTALAGKCLGAFLPLLPWLGWIPEGGGLFQHSVVQPAVGGCWFGGGSPCSPMRPFLTLFLCLSQPQVLTLSPFWSMSSWRAEPGVYSFFKNFGRATWLVGS